MMPTLVTYHFGTVELYDNHLVCVMNQGITVIPEYNEELIILAETHFKGKPFGYITNRINSYAVDPSIYKETSKIENLMAFAVVSNKKIAEKTVPVEKMFFDKPFQLFTEMEAAISWVSEVIAREK